MNSQVNVRFPDKLLNKAERYASRHGYDNLQDFIRETVREKVFEDISKEEIGMVKLLLKASKEKNLFGTEEELLKILK